MAKKSILFVDDEASLLHSLKRVLRPIDDDWHMAFTESASQALIMMELVPVDVVVSDMCMPQIDGLEFLQLVKEKYPVTVRVMMTGQFDYEVYREGTEISQYFLWKPVQPSALETLLQLLSKKEVKLGDARQSDHDCGS